MLVSYELLFLFIICDLDNLFFIHVVFIFYGLYLDFWKLTYYHITFWYTLTVELWSGSSSDKLWNSEENEDWLCRCFEWFVVLKKLSITWTSFLRFITFNISLSKNCNLSSNWGENTLFGSFFPLNNVFLISISLPLEPSIGCSVKYFDKISRAFWTLNFLFSAFNKALKLY